MSYKTIHVHNVTGIKYLYSVESYWDKEKKQSRNRQVCLGRIDESTGEVIPSERKKRDSERIVAAVSCKNTVAKSLICGPAWVLDKIVSDLELDKIVYECLGLDMGRHALSLAYFLIERGWPLSNCDGWSETHQHPYGEIITSQKTSELLKNITKNQIESFFKKWINKLTIKESFCYNITSISSYSENNSFMEWGYNRDKEELKQVNLAIIFGQDSGLPAYYRLIPGSIPDVVTLKKTLKSTTFLDQSKMTFVMDRGFNSESNINEFFKFKFKFVLAVPTTQNWIKTVLNEYYDFINNAKYYRPFQGEPVFMLTHLHNWNGHRCYVHIYFNPQKGIDGLVSFMDKIYTVKNEIENGSVSEKDLVSFSEYFEIFNTLKGIKVEFNQKTIDDVKLKQLGYFCILTNYKMTTEETLWIYQNRDVVEKCFDDCKNELDLQRLRINSTEVMDAKLLIHFFALIILSKIRKTKRSSTNLQKLSAKEILSKLETISLIKYSGHYGKIYSDVGVAQREILTVFDVKTPT